eukprot:31162-Pelagococcus_subviridis.AAC.16
MRCVAEGGRVESNRVPRSLRVVECFACVIFAFVCCVCLLLVVLLRDRVAWAVPPLVLLAYRERGVLKKYLPDEPRRAQPRERDVPDERDRPAPRFHEADDPRTLHDPRRRRLPRRLVRVHRRLDALERAAEALPAAASHRAEVPREHVRVLKRLVRALA